MQAETAYCEQLAFTPWHGLTEHRPLGNINRARKFVLKASQTLRHDNDKLIAEADIRAPRLLEPVVAPAAAAPASAPKDIGPCPVSEGTEACDDCVRALCAPDARGAACEKLGADVDCATMLESLCKTCDEP